MKLRLAFIGFGNVARAFARILESHGDDLAGDLDISWMTTGIATANHGSIISERAIDLIEAVRAVESGEDLSVLGASVPVRDSFEVVERCKADILFETTTLNPVDGEPAVSLIRHALGLGISVVTANKGPVAYAYRELKTIANRNGLSFRFEGTVMDGAPVFNLSEYCLPAAKVMGFAGVLNSTTNVVLDGMEEGLSFQESLSIAQRLGVAEANADYDIDGWDASVKAVILANVLMGADISPDEVERKGIRDITGEDVKAARRESKIIRLIAGGSIDDNRVRLRVAPELVAVDGPLGSTRGTSNVLMLRTDLMGEIGIIENNPGVGQTAYALLSDMLRIIKGARGT